MVKLGDFINNLALKAGVKADDKNLISILSTQGLNDIQIADDIAGAVDNNLLSIEVAQKGHPALKSHYYARAFNGLDAELEDLMKANDFDQDTINIMKAEQSSTKRAVMIANKIKDFEKAKAGAAAPDKAAIAQQIAALNAELATEKKTKAELKAQYEGQIKNIKVRQQLGSILSQYKTVYDDLPIEAKNAAIDALLNQKLQENKAEFTFADNGALDLRTTDGMNVFGPNNIQLTPQTFLDTTLAKILKQTEPAGQQTPNGSNIQNPPRSGAQPPQNIGVNPSLAAAIAQSRASYETASQAMQ